MFIYSSTRSELALRAIPTAYELEVMQIRLEMKLFECGLDIDPNSNLQRFHIEIALKAVYSPSLAN